MSAGSDVFDVNSIPPPASVTPVALLMCPVDQGVVNLSWTNGPLSYDMIRVDRTTLAGVTTVLAMLPGNATSHPDSGQVGSFRYGVTAIISGVESERRECIATVGPGQLLERTTITTGNATALFLDLARVPNANLADPQVVAYYAIDAATRTILGLNGNFGIVSTVPDPFQGTVATLTGIAVDPSGDMGSLSILVIGGGLGQPVRVREVRMNGALLHEWFPRENGMPIMGLPFAMTYADLTGLVLFIGPIGCEVFAFARTSASGNVDTDPDLSFVHPSPAPSLNGIDLPPGSNYGIPGAGFLSLTSDTTPVIPGADFEYAIVTYSFAGSSPIEAWRIPLTILDEEIALGGFALGDAVAVTGITTASVYELAAPPRFVRGDCNADGMMNVGDPIVSLDMLFNGMIPLCEAACDANGDDQIDISDPIYLLGVLFAGGPEPPAPYPICGLSSLANLECASFAPCP